MWRKEAAKGATELCLGQYEASQECFAEATAFKTAYLYVVETAHHEEKRLSGDWNAYLQNAEEKLETAILGGDPDLETRAGGQARQYTDEDATKPYFEYWHNRMRALAALIDGDDDRALERLDVVVESDAVPEIVCRRNWAHRDHDLSELAQKTLKTVAADEGSH